MMTIWVGWRTLDTLYQMKQQIKHHQILDEPCLSPEIIHVWGDDNEMFYWSTRLMETMQYQRKHVLHNFLLLHFLTCQKLGLRASCFTTDSKHVETDECCFCFPVLGSRDEALAIFFFFWHINLNIYFKWNWRRIQAIRSEERGIVWSTWPWISVSYSVKITFLEGGKPSFLVSFWRLCWSLLHCNF